MSNLIELILGAIFAQFGKWYQTAFMGGLNQLPQVLLSFLLSYLVIQLLFFIFPPLKKLMLLLGAPFRYMHVWLHINTAKRIEMNKYKIENQKTRSLGFWGENKGNDIIPLLQPYFSTIDALKIASAPFLGAITLFVFLIMSNPIFGGLGLFGLIFHIYLIFCCFGLAVPSLKDYSFLIRGSTISPGSFHPGYVLWTYFVFAISGYIALERTSSAITGLKEGVFYALVYFFLFLIISKVGESNNSVE